MDIMYCKYTRIIYIRHRINILYFMFKKMNILRVWTFGSGHKLIVLGVNGVAMARHGLILNRSEAIGCGKVSGYLPDLWDTI